MLVTYSHIRNRWEVVSTYEERHTVNPLVKQTGFAFDGAAKVWHTAGYREPRPMKEQARIAAKLLQYCDGAAKLQLSNHLEDVVAVNAEALRVEAETTAHGKASLEASRATDAAIDIPVPNRIGRNGKPLAYLPFQKAGIAYANTRQHCLIGDEMGLGKTIQGVGISNCDPSVRKVLVISPATPKINWRDEWRLWDTKDLTVGVVNAKSEGLPDTDVVIINFDIVMKFHAELVAHQWDLMIVDECHKVKNQDALRTKHILGAPASKKKDKATGKMVPTPAIPAINARRRVFLTGTPILNRPVELWTLIHNLDPDGLGRSFFKYALRYCGATQTKYGWDFKGSSNLDELQDYLRSKFMVRRLKADVLKDLPPKRRQVVLIEPDEKGRKLIEKEKAAWDAVKGGKVKMEEVGCDLGSMSSVRKDVAVYKIPFIIDHVNDMLEAGINKIVVMVHHKEVVDALMKEYGSAAVKVDGRVTKVEDRQAAVDRFQKDPTCTIFIGSIQAAGVAITLTAASHAVFGEIDWVPGNMHQAEDRIHRIGQLESCLIQYILLEESLDANMVNGLIEKIEVIDKALDVRHEPKPEIAKPAVGVKEPPKPVVTATGAVKIEIRDKAKGGMVAVELTLANIEAIHQGLRMLRRVCDGAVALDGRGFSGADKDFGWSLADSPRLSPKQAAYGQRFIRKYQGQLPEELVIAAGVVLKD